MVWVFVTIDGNMNAQIYSEILKAELINSINHHNFHPEQIIIQHDNDPKHISKLAKQTLEELHIEVMEWPAQSPDMNQIEHLWDHIERKLRKQNKQYSSTDELWQDLKVIVSKNYTNYCRKLFPQCLRELLI